jgi:hypothetical protein
MSKIQIPDIKRGKGMFLNKGQWCAIYFEDGKQRRKCLGTDNETAAVKLRDKFFRSLVLKGASIKKTLTRLEKVAANPNRYIIRRKPYLVKVGAVTVGEFNTVGEARGARDGYLGKERKKSIRGRN